MIDSSSFEGNKMKLGSGMYDKNTNEIEIQ